MLGNAPDVVITDVAAVEQNLARLHVVKPLDEQDDRAFAAATRADERHALLRLDNEVEVVEDEGLGTRGVREAHVSELDSALKRRSTVAAGYDAFV